MTRPADHEAAPDAAAPEFRIVAGNPTPAELAAVTAVLTGVLDELSAEQGRLAHTGPSAWAISQRPIRSTIAPGQGAWRSFSA
ncbi:acyl-CoA carboxylase subunit epsilon [Glaciihabitans arcticus]|uniref:Acyl-CoA carboxylase subunit epsilon n=1 Tax=Glaciihabitans arcticus TaxID=2668039 RepID=A0A4V2JEK2_9MICO|nr:acyl-CoA carboxylase subunit epsilon [Glaciihabitans arcticus]TBN55929.1 acyl-CoA carboxylase subunit epsilon [Glaciihabitans arcticus]